MCRNIIRIVIFQNVSVNASIFTLTAIAVDRYKAIIYPLRSHASKFRTKGMDCNKIRKPPQRQSEFWRCHSNYRRKFCAQENQDCDIVNLTKKWISFEKIWILVTCTIGLLRCVLITV